jgi:hypothetical protein
MRPDSSAYEHALSQLAAIARIRGEVCALARALCRESRCGMFLPARDLDHALACIAEAIDDLFFEHSGEARAVKEQWERAERQAALREWESF